MSRISTSNIIIEIANTQGNVLRDSLSTVRCFKTKNLTWKNYDDYIISMDINSPVQVVCQYLDLLRSDCLDSSDVVLTGPCKNAAPIKEERCHSLLREYLDNSTEMSFTVVDTFLGIFAQELRRMSASMYLQPKISKTC